MVAYGHHSPTFTDLVVHLCEVEADRWMTTTSRVRYNADIEDVERSMEIYLIGT